MIFGQHTEKRKAASVSQTEEGTVNDTITEYQPSEKSQPASDHRHGARTVRDDLRQRRGRTRHTLKQEEGRMIIYSKLLLLAVPVLIMSACNPTTSGGQTGSPAETPRTEQRPPSTQKTPPEATPATEMKHPEGIKIGLVDNSRYQHQDGCGCGFWLIGRKPKLNDPSAQKYILIGNYDKQAWMNIDGEIVQFELVKDTTEYKGKIGNRYFQSYQSGDIAVNVECVATGFGDIHGVDCNATITVIRGVQKQVMKAAGSCGC
jgi:hypothetical protein